MSNVWKIFQEKTHANKAKAYFGSSRRYQDSRQLLQNPKVPKNVMGFNNHAQRSTPPYYLDVDNHFPILPNSRSNQKKNQIKPKIWRGSIIG